MELGIYTFVERSREISAAQRMRELMDEIELADQVGLDVFGIGEHHRPDYIASAPAVVLAAASQRSKRIRLTSAVSVISSDDPVRVFEEFATLDVLSNGRAEIMAGRGSFIESFPLFGYDLRDYAADTAAFLAGAVGEPAVVYGHSLGAEVAVMAAAMQPGLVRAVVHGDVMFSRDDRPAPADEDNLQYRLHMAQNELWHRLAGRPVAEIAAALRDMPVFVPGTAEPVRAAGSDAPVLDPVSFPAAGVASLPAAGAASLPTAFVGLALRRSFLAQPEPLKWTAGGESSFFMAPPHVSQAAGPGPSTPWTTSTTRPRSSTTIWSASRTVERRCAMAIVVRPAESRSSASCTARSVCVSSDEVASSSTRIGGLRRIVRAIAMRCFSPPEKR